MWDPPPGLAPEELELWEFLTPRLKKEGVLVESDLPAYRLVIGSLASGKGLLDRIWGQARKAEQASGDRGQALAEALLTRYPNDTLGPAATTQEFHRFLKQIRLWSGHFGLTPRSRALLNAEPASDGDDGEIEEMIL